MSGNLGLYKYLLPCNENILLVYIPCIYVYNMDMEAQYCVPFLILQQNNAKQGNRPQLLATNLVPQNSSGSSPPSLLGHTHILEGHSSHVAHPLAATAPELGQLTLIIYCVPR